MEKMQVGVEEDKKPYYIGEGRVPDEQRDLLLKMYRDMLLIRKTEERVGEMVAEKKIKCPAHLYIGQEAVAVGVCSCLNRNDYVFGTHRAHGLYLAKGGDLNAMMAELFGREAGCSGGRGGSMHMVQPEIGVLGTSSIVGGCLPIGVGAGLACSMRNDGRISVIFFGDGAMDEGVFFESLNLAVIRKLPVIFVCENNYYATHMRICRRIECDKKGDGNRDTHFCDCDPLSRRVEPFGVTCGRVYGNDVLKVREAAMRAAEHVRSGKGPYFLECQTYRWRGHVGPNWDVDLGLRSQDEIDGWLTRCPIENVSQYIEEHCAGFQEKERIDEEVKKEVEVAINFGSSAPYPSPEDCKHKVFR